MQTIHQQEQEDFFAPFINKSTDDIFKAKNENNIIPRVVFICWFGGHNQPTPIMSENRFAAFKSLVTNIQISVILITLDNYKNFIVPEHDLHPGFSLLSGVHKSDYFRCYLLHHYGGGYHDIKHRQIGWSECWNHENWLANPNLWLFGRREKNKGAIGCLKIRGKFNKLATMGWVICKPKTPYTTRLLATIEEKISEKMVRLEQYPGTESAGYYSTTPFEEAPNDGYPFGWLELLGKIFHPLMLEYTNHIQFGLPDAIKSKRYK